MPAAAPQARAGAALLLGLASLSASLRTEGPKLQVCQGFASQRARAGLGKVYFFKRQSGLRQQLSAQSQLYK